ncbi:GNAT family N-acetyltransferase [Pseudozobellia sp. WGM2]|uniref:GNAT family N-acetyltransferase n=1 Tax=Pseudozobellia sp. WGM2 TaxID=2787625 RepID=UPI001FD740CD|nr:GNAT family N-acetyltransferase [Pseudozobellia sp. WGM2]
MEIRQAKTEDVREIVRMIANDKLGSVREDFQEPLPQKYYQAFENIDNDPNQFLMVMENDKKKVVATLQLSFIQYLTYQGGIRAQVEAVRVHENYRSKGLGKKFSIGQSSLQKIKGAT